MVNTKCNYLCIHVSVSQDPSPYGMLVDDTSHSFPQAEAFSLDKHTNNMEDSGYV